MHKLKLLAAGLATAAVAAGCATDPYYDSYYNGGTRYVPASAYPGNPVEYGRVVAIDHVRTPGGGGTSGAGAVVGGLVGGVLGHQIGSGRGNDAATVAGAIGGAIVGNNMERNRGAGGEYWRVVVEFNDRRTATFAMDSLHGVRVGDRVRVEGDRLYRD